MSRCFLPLEDQAETANLLAIIFPGDAEVAGGGALADAVQDAGAKPAPAVVLGGDIQRAGAKLEDALEHLHRRPEALGAGEGAIELHAAAARRARELDARKLLANADLQVRERLAVLEIDVEARLNVLDEAGFHQESVDLGVGGQKVDVGDLLDHVGRTLVLLGRPGEVMPGAVTQVLGLADVDDPALGILHQVDAGRRRELLHLVGGANDLDGKRDRGDRNRWRGFGAFVRHANLLVVQQKRATGTN